MSLRPRLQTSVALFAASATVLLCGARAVQASGYGPFGAGLPEDGFSWLTMFPRLFMLAIEAQTYFNERLTVLVRSLSHDPGAVWALMALSFAYGVIHALGPGHGKAVISSYVLANRQTIRNGVLLSLLAALSQSAGAIALIAAATALLHMTSVAITDVTYRFEIGSDLLIVALGVWLVYVKVVRRGRALKAAACASDMRLAPAGASRFQAIGISDGAPREAYSGDVCDCGGLHVRNAASEQLDWKKAWSVLAMTALRPCTGALILLVFARVEKVFLLGVIAVIVMGLGVSVTVSALAIGAGFLRGVSAKLAQTRRSGMSRILPALEILGSFALLSFGLTMLAVNLAMR